MHTPLFGEENWRGGTRRKPYRLTCCSYCHQKQGRQWLLLFGGIDPFPLHLVQQALTLTYFQQQQFSRLFLDCSTRKVGYCVIMGTTHFVST